MPPQYPSSTSTKFAQDERVTGKTMSVALDGHLLLCVHSEQAPSECDWDSLLELAGRRRIDGMLVLVPPACPGPSAGQRKRSAERWKELGYVPPIAVLTESRLLRGVITAMNWLLGNKIKAFDPTSLEDARQYLGLSAPTWSAQIDRSRLLAEELGVAEHLPYLGH